MSARFSPPGQCPVCGEWAAAGAAACDECGACEKSGWGSGTQTDGLDLPDDDFDYESFAASEFGTRPAQGLGPKQLWRWAATILLALLITAALAPGCAQR